MLLANQTVASKILESFPMPLGEELHEAKSHLSIYYHLFSTGTDGWTMLCRPCNWMNGILGVHLHLCLYIEACLLLPCVFGVSVSPSIRKQSQVFFSCL